MGKQLILPIIIILGFLIFNYFKSNEVLELIQKNEKNEKIQRELDKILILDSLKNELQNRDKKADINVKNIYNTYETIYNQINDTNYNDFLPIIDSLLKRHDKIRFERNY